MAIVAIPTLGNTTFITDPGLMLQYGLRQYATAPKSALEVCRAETISLRETVSRYAAQPQTLSTQVVNDLMSMYNRLFPPAGSTNVVVSIDPVVGDPNGNYNIVITASTIVNNQTYTISGNVLVSKNGTLILENDTVTFPTGDTSTNFVTPLTIIPSSS